MKNNENYNKMQAEENESFQTNFFLEFKNEKNRETFSTFYLTSQNLLTEIYLFILIFVMVMIYLLRYCFKIDSNMDFHCRHHFLYFFSLFFLIFTFISIKLSSNLVKNPIFLQICMLFGNLYLYTAIIGLEIIPEVIWISLSIMITICNSIVSVSWKYHLGFLLFSILIIHYYLLFSGNLIYKLYLVDWAIALKIIFYNLVMVALKEKIFKEIWVLINCARDSEKNLEKVIEVIPIPILVVDSNKNIILINRKCTILLHSLENIKEITHSYLHRNFNDFINETDLEIFNSMIAGVYSKNAIYSRIFALQEIQKKMNTSKGADESKHMRKILSDLTEFIEDSDFRSHALHDLTISGVN